MNATEKKLLAVYKKVFYLVPTTPLQRGYNLAWEDALKAAGISPGEIAGAQDEAYWASKGKPAAGDYWASRTSAPRQRGE